MSEKPAYLFFTYGSPGWRGVQVRGLRVTKHFLRDEVLFWNGGDSQFIEQAGFAVETVDLSLIAPAQIKIPPSVHTVVFTDLPTNELFQFSLFVAARQQGKKIVVIDQAYRRGQAQEFVYRQIAQHCDLLLLNSLSFLQTEEFANVKVIQPLIEFEPETEEKRRLGQRWELPIDRPWLFGIGYHAKVKQKLERVAKSLYDKGIVFQLILTGSSSERQDKKENFLTSLPYQIGDDFFRFIKAADIALIKFGFLQLIEVLALRVHPVVLGEAGYVLQKKSVIDKRIQEAIYLTQDIDEQLLKHLERFLTEPRYRNGFVSKVERLHDGSLQGGQQAATFIKELNADKKEYGKRVEQEKKLAILVNDELRQYKRFIGQCEGVYVVGLIASVPVGTYIIKRPDESLLAAPVDELIITQPDEILPHSFKETYIFSRRKYDGLTEIVLWYDLWIKRLEELLVAADKIYLTKLGRLLLKNMLESKRLELKIRLID